MDAVKELEKEYIKKDMPDIRSGDTVKIHQKIHEKGKDRIQIFEGLVIRRHGGKGLSGTFTVRKIAADGIGVERNFFLHSPTISKIQVVKKGKVRRAQLYYIRRKQLKSLKLKERKDYQGIKDWEEAEKPKDEQKREASEPKDEVKEKPVKEESKKDESKDIKDKTQNKPEVTDKESKESKNDKK